MDSELALRSAPAPAEEAPAHREDELHLRLRTNAGYFLFLSLGLGALFALFFVDAFALGLNAAVLSAAMAAATLLALGKLGLRRKKRDLFWTVSTVLLGFSVCWTVNAATQGISFCGMFLAEILWLMDAFTDIFSWHFGRVVYGCLRFIGRILTHLAEPFCHLAALRRAGRQGARGVLFGIIIAVPLLWVVVPLLSSADAAFGTLVERIFDGGRPSDAVRSALRIVIYTLVPAVIFYSALAAQSDHSEFPVKEKHRLHAVTAIIFTGALAVVYAVFCFIQIAVLFAGDVSALPEGVTYAEYAREGFFQLLLVSTINVVLILAAQRRFVLSRMLRALLVFLTLCTYLMEASSAMRMMLYISAYGLTYLRLLVLWFLVLLAFLLGAAIYAVFHENFRLFRFALIVCMALWLVFAFARPDTVAARYNLARRGLDDTTETQITHDSSHDSILALRPYFSAIDRHGEGATVYLDLTISVPHDYAARGVRSFNFSAWEAMRIAEDYINGN